MTQPCECGLERPRRLFGRSDNRTQAAPRSKTGSMTPEMVGLACVFNLAGFAPAGNSEIQEIGVGAIGRHPEAVAIKGGGQTAAKRTVDV